MLSPAYRRGMAARWSDPFTASFRLRRRYIADRFWMPAGALIAASGYLSADVDARWRWLGGGTTVAAFGLLAVGLLWTKHRKDTAKRPPV